MENFRLIKVIADSVTYNFLVYTATVNPVKETMNLQSLQWTKNVIPAEGWAYNRFKVADLFKLAWKDDKANANRPERYDLILLRQHGYVTHVVKVLNRQADRDDDPSVFNIYRIVEVVLETII